MRTRLRTRQLVIALSILGAVSACGSDDGGSDSGGTEPAAAETSAPAADSSAPADSSAAAETTAAAGSGDEAAGGALTISDFAFSPSELTVPAGTIDITNEDGATHSVTADDETFDVEVSGGGAASITVDTPGSYSYHCRFHPSMTGTLVVT